MPTSTGHSHSIHAQPNFRTISLRRFLSCTGMVTGIVSFRPSRSAMPAVSRLYCVRRFIHISAGIPRAFSSATAIFIETERLPEMVSLITDALMPVISASFFCVSFLSFNSSLISSPGCVATKGTRALLFIMLGYCKLYIHNSPLQS